MTNTLVRVNEKKLFVALSAASLIIHGLVLLRQNVSALNFQFTAQSMGQTSRHMQISIQRPASRPKPVVKNRPKKKVRKKATTIEEEKKPTTAQTKSQQKSDSINNEQRFSKYNFFYKKPIYPRMALRRKIKGRVILLLNIDKNGRITNVEVAKSSGHKILDDSALAGARQWKFHAPNKNISLLKPIVFKI